MFVIVTKEIMVFVRGERFWYVKGLGEVRGYRVIWFIVIGGKK